MEWLSIEIILVVLVFVVLLFLFSVKSKPSKTAKGKNDRGKYIKIAAGGYHNLALREDGTVWAWGNNKYGQLGTGGRDYKSSPVEIRSLKNIRDIDAFGDHNLALKEDGTVWAWGSNECGQLGDGTTVDKRGPVQVLGLKNIKHIAAGQSHCIAWSEDGNLWLWGCARELEKEGKVTKIHSYPIKAGEIKGVRSLVAFPANLALREDGTVWQLVRNTQDGSESGSFEEKKELAGTRTLCAGIKAYAIKGDGTVWSAGVVEEDEVGEGEVFVNLEKDINNVRLITTEEEEVVFLMEDDTILYSMGTLSNVAMISSGYRHTIALKKDGTLWAWAKNTREEVEEEKEKEKSKINQPMKMEKLSDIVAIEANQNEGLALKGDGTLWNWGMQSAAKLLTLGHHGVNLPSEINDIDDIKDIKLGEFYTFIVKTDGSIWRWDVANGDPIEIERGSNVKEVLLLKDRLLGQKKDGTFFDFNGKHIRKLDGIKDFKEATLKYLFDYTDKNARFGEIKNIIEGENGTIIINTEGNVWTNEVEPDLNKPIFHRVPILDGIKDAVVGGSDEEHPNLILRPDGTIWRWVKENPLFLVPKEEDLIQVEGISDAKAIINGGKYGFALKEDGTVWTWKNEFFIEPEEETKEEVPQVKPSKINEAKDWNEVKERTAASKYKIWAVRFGDAIDKTTITEETIYVAEDAAGNMPLSGVQVKLDPENPNVALVKPPAKGWEVGKDHYIFVTTEVKSKKKKQALAEGLRMKFTIKR